MQQPKLTLLAPARNLEIGKAAINAGADAVYIGANMFGARQAAANSLTDIEQLVKYAHIFDAQVLVTLNTLLHPEEYDTACTLAHQLYNIGVDALIIQDLNLLNHNLPPIRLHASTQCDNRTPEQVLALQQLGFRRAVLARELNITEIQNIHTAITQSQAPNPIELEAFVHGAVCVCYSGRCYMSEALMNRSANRGCCAQMCRMKYDLLDKNYNEIIDDNGQPIHQRYLLSLQDMDRSRYLHELINAGVTTFKIEGRLKDQDYVTNIVAYYRQRIDNITQTQHRNYTTAQDIITYTFTPNPQKTFHRGGTDYFLHARSQNIANWETPKSTGENIGTIAYLHKNAIGIALQPNISLHNGDGLCYGDQGFAINNVLEVQKPNNGQHIAEVLPNRMPHLTVNTTLYRNQDTEFLRKLHAERHIPINITFQDTPNGYQLTMTKVQDHNIIAELTITATHQTAQNTTRAINTIREQLSKLGDTPYIANHIQILHQDSECVNEYPYFLPIGTLNNLRRQLVQQAILHATTIQPTDTPAPHTSVPPAKHISEQPLMICKYCLLYEMGHCRKINPLHIEPQYLQLHNGTRVTLRFDCAKCRMLILKE